MVSTHRAKHSIRWHLGAFLYAFLGVGAFLYAFGVLVPTQVRATFDGNNRVLSYQIRLTDTGGTAVADGTKNI
ncbi:hypothetical protein HY633_05315 [Candidatus Uhrbacteria bacterium]|nr:hypothetical protein [Candidatus Uhrbacteria bacterium]